MLSHDNKVEGGGEGVWKGMAYASAFAGTCRR